MTGGIRGAAVTEAPHAGVTKTGFRGRAVPALAASRVEYDTGRLARRGSVLWAEAHTTSKSTERGYETQYGVNQPRFDTI